MSTTPRTRWIAAALLVCTASITACSSDGESGAATVKVTGTNTGCELAASTVKPGRVTLAFTNTATEVNEVYLTSAAGKVVGEVEDVPTGVKRNLNATVEAGEYKVTCKPGQSGNGFSSKLTVSAS